jgi:pyrroloquinoline quinone biosynthesis protein D
MSNTFDMSAIPRLGSRFRFQWEDAQQSHVLLYPEGMVKLNAAAGEILKRCDGVRSIGDLVADLERQFPGADLTSDVLEFLGDAHDKGWIAF